MAEAEEVADAAGKHDSVVYVHGMGSQRRYEETSRLIDRLDQYLGRRHREGQSLGMLMNIKARVEPCRPAGKPDEIVGYIRTAYSAGPKQPVRSTRFYEVYWAPVMADARSPWGVVKWLFRQPLRPWSTVRAPWRERQRLRRASLAELVGRARPAGTEERDFAKLARLYDEFEGPDAQRRFAAGTFDEFMAFVAEESANKPDTLARLQTLARAWRAAYVRSEALNAFALASIALLLLLFAGAAVFGILVALQWALGFALLADLLHKANAPVTADSKTAIGIAVALAGFAGLSRFLTDFMGDVEAWATYEETDVKNVARNKVLDQATATLTHVLTDETCERVTVVAHSLGTSVAHDALLALTRRNSAVNVDDPIAGPIPLTKIEHFVTMGSPIDKIEYFFESSSSPFHRYRRVIEALRGDIGTPPFSRNRRPYVHWINFWDQGDAISGPLYSPTNRKEFAQRVDNVHVVNFDFPDPSASHSGYFDNRTVLGVLFDVIYKRGASFRTLTQPAPNQPYDYGSVYLGPGEPCGERTVYFALAAAVPWLGLAGLVGWLADCRAVTTLSWGVATFAFLWLALAWGLSVAEGQRRPI